MQALLLAARDQSHLPTTDDGIGAEVDLAEVDVDAGSTGSGANGGAVPTTMGANGTGANNDVRCPTGGGEPPLAKRLRVGQPCSDSDDGSDEERPIQLLRVRRSRTVVEVGQTANLTLGNPHGGGAGRSDSRSRFAHC